MEDLPAMVNTTDMGGYQRILDNEEDTEVEANNLSTEETVTENSPEIDEQPQLGGAPNKSELPGSNKEHLINETQVSTANNDSHGSLNGAVLNQDPLNGAVLNQDPLNGAVLNQDPLNGAVLNQDPLNGVVLNQDPLNGAVLNQDPLNGAVLNQDQLNGAVLNQDQQNGAVLNQDPLDGAVLNQDALDRAVLNKDPLDGAVLNQDPLDRAVLNQDPLNGALTNQDVEETVGENDHDLLSNRKEASLPSEDHSPGLHATEQRAVNEVSEPGEEVPMISGQKQGGGGGSSKGSESDIPLGFEAVLSELGGPGRFVVFQLILHLFNHFCLSSTALIYVFIGFEPPHSCKQLANESELLSPYQLVNSSTHQVSYGTCDITVTSNRSGSLETVAAFHCLEGHDYKGGKHISFVSEWDVVCGNARWKELVQLILLVGQTVGGIVCTSIADKYGRRPVLLISNLGLCAAGIGAAYSPNIYALIFFKFLCGVFQQGTGLVSFTMMMEVLTAKHRQVVAILSGLVWTLSIMVMAAMAYLMRDESWRYLQTAVALFACNVLLYPIFLTESPRWLIANNRHKEALEIIKKACQSGGKDYEKVKAVFDLNIKQENDISNKEEAVMNSAGSQVERYSLLDIVRHRLLLVMVLILFFLWITNSSTYYGLFLASSSLAGNRYLNFFLMSCVDLPADIVNLFLFYYFGRKPIIMSWLIVAGSGLLTATMFMAFGTSSTTSILANVFSFVGKLGIGASFNGLFMYTPELFPTNLRSAGMGVCSGVARIGGMLAPYAQLLAQVVIWGPGILFSSMCFLSAIMFMKLPETRDRPMPNTIKEMKQRVMRQSKQKTNQDNVHEFQIVSTKDPATEV